MAQSQQPDEAHRHLVERLVARRERLHLSQLAVDELVGLPSGYTAKVEAFLRSPRLSTLMLICQALGLHLVPVPMCEADQSRGLVALRHSLAKPDRSQRP